MANSSDDPASDRSSAEAPSTQPAAGHGNEPTSPSEANSAAESVSAAGDPQSATADVEKVPRLPRHRRRRRRRPPRPADPTQATAAQQHQAELPAPGVDAAQTGDLPALSPSAVGPRRRRRRRRGPPREPGAARMAADGEIEAAESAPEAPPDVTLAGDGDPRQGQPHAQPHAGRRRQRPPRLAQTPAGEGEDVSPARGRRTGAPQYRSAPYRGSQNRETRNRRDGDARSPESGPARDDRRPADRRARGNRPPGRNDRRPARDRDAPRKKPEPRLYALEAIVDRGFEDVVDAAEDNLTRRVHWTIVKRTLADQESGKPISATYVLKREGVDTEFPGLAAARSAANKTIVHPEKLTMSKAEHAAEHAAAKK